jgi:uncharacterized protein (DUF58 family)
MARLFTIVLTVAFAFLFFAPSAFAGGWATITFDELPSDIQAGDAITVRFLVKQHGNNPVHVAFGSPLEATVQITLPDDKNAVSVEATPDTEVGYYVATITFPKEGLYELRVLTNALDTTEVAPNPLSVSVSAAPDPVLDSTSSALIAGATATAPLGVTPITIALAFGILVLLGGGAVAITRTR